MAGEQREDRVMQWVGLDPSVQDAVRARMESVGIQVVTGAGAIDVSPPEMRYGEGRIVVTSGPNAGKVLQCDAFVSATGREGLCAAQALADRARAAFLTSGCGAVSLDKRFDVLQVGAHVGNSRDDANRLLDPVFAWLRTAPAHASVLLVEPMCVVRVRTFKLPSRHASAIDATTDRRRGSDGGNPTH